MYSLWNISFQVFRSKVLAYGNDIFFFESIIDYCYESLKFSDNQKLFLYLHIDEFQMIDAWDAKNETKELFKNMIRNLAKYMLTENLTFIQQEQHHELLLNKKKLQISHFNLLIVHYWTIHQ